MSFQMLMRTKYSGQTYGIQKKVQLTQRKKVYYHEDNLKITGKSSPAQCRNQAHQLNNLISLHSCIAKQMDEMVNNNEVIPA